MVSRSCPQAAVNMPVRPEEPSCHQSMQVHWGRKALRALTTDGWTFPMMTDR